MTDLQVSGHEVLAQRTRARIFAWLVERATAASTEEIATHLGLHRNGVRRHLELMSEAGLLERRRSRGERGRPGDRWLVAERERRDGERPYRDGERQHGEHPEGERSDGERPRRYADLARWLARAIPAAPDSLREVERAGREVGAELAPREGAGDPAEAFRRAIASLGFQPVLEAGEEGEFSCRLGNCPYRDSARENADVVCTLHRGITEGLLAGISPAAELVRFEPHDPERAGCEVEVAAPARGAGRAG